MKKVVIYQIALLLSLWCMSTPAHAQTDLLTDPKSQVSMTFEKPLDFGSFVLGQFKFQNRRGTARLSLQINQSVGYASVRSQNHLTFDLPPGETQLELPFFNPSTGTNVEVRVAVNGRFVPEMTTTNWSSYQLDKLIFIILGGGPRNRLEKEALSQVTVFDLTREQVPRHWQGYLGRRAAAFIRSQTIEQLDAAQAQALGYWIKYGGGLLWILTEDDPHHADTLEMTLSNRFQPSLSEINADRAETEEIPDYPKPMAWYRAGTGRVIVSSSDTLDKLTDDQLISLPDIVSETAGLFKQKESYYGYGYGYNGFGNNLAEMLFDNLHVVPKFGYAIIAILLGLIIGPINLIILRKRKRIVLFYVTAPILALCGMIALGVFTLTSEGIHLKINEKTVLLHDLDRNEGALYRGRGFFGPFSPGSIPLTTETAVLPFFSNRTSRKNIWMKTDWSSAQTLKSGWIRSRELSGILTATPGRFRLGLRPVVHGPGDVRIISELKGSARHVWVRITDPVAPGYYYADEVLPGKKTRLRKSNASDKKAHYPYVDTVDLDWTVLAETDWLPGLENGDVKGEHLTKEYYYIGLKQSTTSPALANKEFSHE